MKKSDELADPTSCLNKAGPDEMLFTLRARDPVSPTVIRFWAAERIRLGLNTLDDAKILEAIRCATEMEIQLPEIRATEFRKGLSG